MLCNGAEIHCGGKVVYLYRHMSSLPTTMNAHVHFSMQAVSWICLLITPPTQSTLVELRIFSGKDHHTANSDETQAATSKSPECN